MSISSSSSSTNVNLVNLEASKLLMKGSHGGPGDIDDPDDPNSPENIARQQQQFNENQLDNMRAQSDITSGTNTGMSVSPNNQIMAVASHDSVSTAGANPQTEALGAIQSQSLEGPTQRVPGLPNFKPSDFDPSQRI